MILDNAQWILISVIGVGVTGCFGFVLIRRLWPELELQHTIGTSILVGLSTFGVVQSSVPLLRRYPWLALVLVGIAAMLLSITPWLWQRIPLGTRANRMGQPITSKFLEAQSALVIPGIAVFAVSPSFAVWTRIFGITFLGLGLNVKHLAGRSAGCRTVIGLAFGVLLITTEWIRRLEPRWWFSTNNDVPYFESLAWSLTTNGPGVHPGLPERTIHGYHYLAYAVGGSLSHLSGAPPYVVLNIVMPFLTLVSLSLVLLPELRRRTNSLVGAATVLILYTTLLEPSSMTSFRYSVWATAVYLVLAMNNCSRRLSCRQRLSHELLLALVGSIGVFGKATVLPTLVCIGLWSSWNYVRRIRPSTRLETFIAMPLHLAAPCALFIFYFLANSTAAGSASDMRYRSFVFDALRTNTLSEAVWQIRYALIFILIFAIFLSIAVQKPVDANLDSPNNHTLLGWICVIGIATVISAPEYPVYSYLIEHFNQLLYLILLYPISLLTKVRLRAKEILSLSVIVFSVIAVSAVNVFLVSVWWVELSMTLTGGIRGLRWLEWVVSDVSALSFSVFALVTLQLVWKILTRTRTTWISKFNFLSVASLVFFLVLGSTSLTKTVKNNWELKSSLASALPFASPHPDNATSDVGSFIRQSTPINSVVASNSFCCRGTEWLATEVDLIRGFSNLYAHPLYSESAWGGANYSLASVTRRQFLLAGPRFLINNENAEVVAERLEASVLFGATGSDSYLGALRNDGANIFVVDKQAVDGAIPKFSHPKLFENSRYIVLMLDE